MDAEPQVPVSETPHIREQRKLIKPFLIHLKTYICTLQVRQIQVIGVVNNVLHVEPDHPGKIGSIIIHQINIDCILLKPRLRPHPEGYRLHELVELFGKIGSLRQCHLIPCIMLQGINRRTKGTKNHYSCKKQEFARHHNYTFIINSSYLNVNKHLSKNNIKYIDRGGLKHYIEFYIQTVCMSGKG